MRTILGGLIVAALALPAAAHHSGSMFDDKKSVTLTGTVKAFQWTNPPHRRRGADDDRSMKTFVRGSPVS